MRDFNHTIGVLVKAFMEGTLQHTNCHACAVGNMVADAKGISFVEEYNNFSQRMEPTWQDGILPMWFNGIWDGQVQEVDPEMKKEIEATGYTPVEIARIEYAFEGVSTGSWGSNDKDGYKGLMAVVDVLADIHGIDLTAKQEAKKLFVKI